MIMLALATMFCACFNLLILSTEQILISIMALRAYHTWLMSKNLAFTMDAQVTRVALLQSCRSHVVSKHMNGRQMSHYAVTVH